MLGTFIDGRAETGTGQQVELVDPSTGEAFESFAEASAADVDRAVRSAAAAFPDWSARTPGDRATILAKVADALAEASDLVDLEVRETGKPRTVFADGELPFGLDNLRFFAGAARSLDGTGAGQLHLWLHVPDGPAAAGRRGRHRPVELPLHHGHLEARPRARRGQHDGAEAGSRNSLLDPAAR